MSTRTSYEKGVCLLSVTSTNGKLRSGQCYQKTSTTIECSHTRNIKPQSVIQLTAISTNVYSSITCFHFIDNETWSIHCVFTNMTTVYRSIHRYSLTSWVLWWLINPIHCYNASHITRQVWRIADKCGLIQCYYSTSAHKALYVVIMTSPVFTRPSTYYLRSSFFIPVSTG